MSQENADARALRFGAATTGAIALLCAGMAVWASERGCGSTDGTFSIDSPLARPSDFCRDTHFPGFPDTVSSVLLVAAIYLTPVVVATLGTVVAAKTGSRRVLMGSLWLAAGLTFGTALVSSMASVGYAGGG